MSSRKALAPSTAITSLVSLHRAGYGQIPRRRARFLTIIAWVTLGVLAMLWADFLAVSVLFGISMS